MAGDRKPLLVLVALVLLVVALAVTGAIGAGRGSAATTRTSWFDRGGGGGGLRPDEVHADSGACAVSGGTITLTGVCGLVVDPVRGGWPWSRAVRRVRLRVGQGSVVVVQRVQDRTMKSTLDAGEDVRLVFTRDGGPLSLGCVSPGGCVANLVAEG